MLRSLFEGYGPVLLIAIVGYNAAGGSFFSWAAFVWIFGALLTVALAYLRVRVGAPNMTAQTIPAVENF